MHLHDHFRATLLKVQHGHHLVHAQLDQVSGCALHGCVDRSAFGTSAARAIRGIDFGQVQAAAKNGLYITFAFGGQARLVHVVFHAGVTLKIPVDVGGCSLGLYAQFARQTKAAHAVNQTEVDHFGIAALLAADLIDGHAEHLGCCGTVYVNAFGKCPQQGRVFADVRHDA